MTPTETSRSRSSGNDLDVDKPETVRPSLVTLSDDVDELTEDLYRGFPTRRDVLTWLQRLSIRTIGEIPQRVVWEIARQYTLDSRADQRQGVLLAALLTSSARSRELPEEAVDELRERFAASQIRPAFHRAFRELRKDATEYVDGAEDGDDDAHDPHKQRHILMRPAIHELDQWQESALRDLLDGFDSRRKILQWGQVVELATHGEINETDPPEWGPETSAERDLIERCYAEPSTRTILLGGTETASARELFAAYHLLPAFNAGVRVLSGRAGEVADAERERSAPKQL